MIIILILFNAMIILTEFNKNLIHKLECGNNYERHP